MPRQGLARVIVASSVGTVIEFYDFFIFASLATTIAAHFYPADQPTFGFLSTLATYARRPRGPAVRLARCSAGSATPSAGRRRFSSRCSMMGTSTAAIGVLPGYATLGAAAPLLLILLRVVQGLALGGEYAGAATYVAEHAPEDRRGYYTSYIQLTPTIGLFASSMIVLGRAARSLGEPAFSRLGMARPVPDLARVRGDLVLHPGAARGVAGLRRAQGAGQGVARRPFARATRRGAMAAVRDHSVRRDRRSGRARARRRRCTCCSSCSAC